MEFKITRIPRDYSREEIYDGPLCPTCVNTGSPKNDPNHFGRATVQIQLTQESPDGNQRSTAPVLSCRAHVGVTADKMIKTEAKTPAQTDPVIEKNLVFADLRGQNLSNQNLESRELDGANLSGANLSGAKLSYAKMNRADLTNANLSGANMRGTLLRETDFKNTNITGADLRYALLTGAKLANANLRNINLFRASLASANLKDADLENAMLSEGHLMNADLQNASLRRANMEGSVLTGANLSEADLTNTSLRSAKLNNTNMKESKLTGADLTNADLTNADLTGADLTGADLTGADLNGTELSGAILPDEELSNEKEEENGNEGEDEENNETAPFKVDIKLKDLERVSRVLQENQIDFDPVGSMICNHPGMFADTAFTGEDAGETVEKINKFLEESQRPERIRVEFREMSPAARRDFLEFINLNASWGFDWSKDQTTLKEANEGSWEMFAAGHPEEVGQSQE